MATGAEIASAYIALTVKMPGVQRDLQRELGGVDSEKAGRKVGSRFGNALKKSAQVGALAAGAAVATLGVAGFRAAAGIESSRKVLGGLYGDAKLAQNVMQQLRDVSKDSPIDYQAYTQAAETLAYAGIEGEKAIGTLQNVGKAITAAGGDSENMQRAMAGVMQGVNNGGIFMMDSLNRISESGVPILSGLAEHFDTTIDQVRKMASAGEVNLTDVMSVLENATGGTFDQMIKAGEAAEGSFENTWKSAKDSVITALGEAMIPILERLTPFIEDAGDALTRFFDQMDVSGIDLSMFSPVGLAFKALAPVLPVVADALGQVMEPIGELAKALLPPLMEIFTALTPVIELVGSIIGALAPIIAPLVTLALLPLMMILKPLTPLFELLGKVIEPVAEVIDALLTPVVEGLTTAVEWVAGAMGEATNDFIPGLGAAFQSVWDVIRPIFEGIGAVAKWLWDTILSPVFDFIKFGFAVVGGIISGVWDFIIKPALDALGRGFKVVWDKFISPVVDWISEKITLLGLVVQYLWLKYVKPVFDKIGAAFKWIWDTIISPVVNWIREKLHVMGLGFTLVWGVIRGAWDNISNKIKSGWDTIKGILDTMVRVVRNDPKKAFEAARDAIGKAWAGIQELAKKPVKFVVETVINGLIGTINKIPGVNIPEVKLPKGFARGGILPGMSRMSDGDDQLIMARRGEGMMVSEALRTPADRSAFLAANAAGRKGVGFASMLQGFARGGLISPLKQGSYTVSQPFHSGHNGIDLAAASGTAIYSAGSGAVTYSQWSPFGGGHEVHVVHDGGLETWYSHMVSPGAPVGTKVRAGTSIGRVGSTGNSTGPHLHYMVMPGGYPNYVNPAPYMGLGGKYDVGGWNPLTGLVDWAAGKIKSAFPDGGMWVDAATGLAKQAAKTVVDVFTPKWGTDSGATLYDSGGWLPTGRSLVENRSGRPEPILTAAQWDSLLEVRAPQGLGRQRLRLVLEDGSEFGAYIDDRADVRARNMVEEML